MNETRKAILDALWRGVDPLAGFPANLIEHDVQGWNSQHPYLLEAIVAVRPLVIVEVGVWKGGSTIFMADRLKAAGFPSVVIAVDTWLGSSEHWLVDDYHAQLPFLNGYPALYHKFASNVVRAGVAGHVVPLPLDSLNAAQVLWGRGVRPAMVHLDGGHDHDSVAADLGAWWPVLAPGGVLVGDDYFTDGTWDGVRRAFDGFFGPLGLGPIENDAGKCRIRKPDEA